MDKVAEIILHEENRRFSVDKTRPAAGRIIMRQQAETVMISIKAGGLRMLDKRRYIYRLMLLGLKGGHSLHRILGDFHADKDGRLEEKWELPEGDIDGHGNGIEDFFVFMLAAVPLERTSEPYHPVMKGDWDRKWEAQGVSSDEGHRHPAEKKDLSYNDYYSTYIREMSARLISERRRFREMQMFEETWMADSWRIVEEPGAFPVASIDAEGSITQNGHFIFAYNDEYLLLGVPGTGEKEQQPDGGASGFSLWQPVRGSAMHGYWLTAVRRRTGEIVGI